MLTLQLHLHKGRRESKQVHLYTGCQLLDTGKMPAIAKKTHREDPIYPGLPATHGDGCGLPPLPLE
jgi:hypothetical protein